MLPTYWSATHSRGARCLKHCGDPRASEAGLLTSVEQRHDGRKEPRDNATQNRYPNLLSDPAMPCCLAEHVAQSVRSRQFQRAQSKRCAESLKRSRGPEINVPRRVKVILASPHSVELEAVNVRDGDHQNAARFKPARSGQEHEPGFRQVFQAVPQRDDIVGLRRRIQHTCCVVRFADIDAVILSRRKVAASWLISIASTLKPASCALTLKSPIQGPISRRSPDCLYLSTGSSRYRSSAASARSASELSGIDW